MANNYVFGANLIENLTTGMYQNSLVIFREYIQNSCDAIDKARPKILGTDEGTVEITIDAENRRITIEDNGTGIPVLDFKSTLTSIAASDKSLDNDRGFRGIGRLCGLAYCKELRFISTAKDEGIKSTMIFDAAKLRSHFYISEKLKAEDILDAVISFKTTPADADEHFFRVEMIGINDTNSDLLDVVAVRDYLSFVAPVTYSANFYYEKLITAHAAELKFKIAEYKILVNGEQVVKNYKTHFKTSRGDDDIFALEFRDFKDKAGNLIAWSWIGLSKFKGVLDETNGTPDNKMRGIRLRAGNIQIGNQDVFKNLFKEDRGTKYFIGEVHAVDKNLIPNGRRDYFIENAARNILEGALEKYFVELYEMYHAASDIRGFCKKINAPAEAERDFQAGRSTLKNRAELDAELAKLNKTAAAAENKISSMRQEAEQNPESPLSRVVLRMTDNQSVITPPPIHIQYRRINKNNFRQNIGRVKRKSFTSRLKTSYSTTQSLRATNSSISWKRSLPNEPPRLADRAELQEQIYSRQLDETCDVFSERVQRRREILQGRLENFCLEVVA